MENSKKKGREQSMHTRVKKETNIKNKMNQTLNTV